MRKRFLLLIITLILIAAGREQAIAQKDSLLIEYLLNRIQQQVAQNDPAFSDGLFPSYINKTERFSWGNPDNSIFFTALTDFTLQQIRPELNASRQSKIDSIVSETLPAFAHFKNRKGRNTYNFWRTDTATVYPYAGWLFDKSITLPDDMDDTVLSLMVQKAADSTAKEVHLLMQSFTNNGQSTLRNPIRAFDKIPAYSTWFGKKFPVVFDVSVLCNILTFVQSYGLDWTNADSASLQLIVKTIENNYHLDIPVYVSPYYPKTSLILYHLSRLMRRKPIPELEQLKVKLIADAAFGLQHSSDLLERIIYSTAILNWGYLPPPVVLPDISEVEQLIEQNNFSFFLGNIPSYFPDLLKKLATTNGLGMFYHYCPAYYNALLLEYIVLQNNGVR